MNKVLVTGGHGSIGLGICQELQDRNIEFVAPTRSQLDLADPKTVDSLDISGIDTVIYCAGTNNGTFLGFENNSTENQIQQINVNFVSALLLAKKFVQSPSAKRYVWIGTDSIYETRAFRVFYTSSKMALKYSLDMLRPEYPSITWSEIQIGRTRTGLLYKNYLGTKSQEQVDREYASMRYLEVPQVVQATFQAIDQKLDIVELPA